MALKVMEGSPQLDFAAHARSKQMLTGRIAMEYSKLQGRSIEQMKGLVWSRIVTKTGTISEEEIVRW